MLSLVFSGCGADESTPSTDSHRTAPCCPASETGQTKFSDGDAARISESCATTFPVLAEFELVDGLVPGSDAEHTIVYPLAPDDRLILSEHSVADLNAAIEQLLSQLETVPSMANTASAVRSQYEAFADERNDDAKEADYGLRLTSFDVLELGNHLALLGATDCEPGGYREG